MVTLSLSSEIYQLSSTERKIATNITPPEYTSPDRSSSSIKKGTIGKYMYIFAYIYTNIYTYMFICICIYIHIIFIHIYAYMYTLI
jgi:hypothetical protein